MGKNSNYSQQFEDESSDMEEWLFEDDWEKESSTHARKEHQNHRGRGKVQTRRSIEDFKEQKLLNELIGNDFDY